VKDPRIVGIEHGPRAGASDPFGNRRELVAQTPGGAGGP